jgi:hypothetical protein
MATLARNEELLTDVLSLLRQVSARQEVLALDVRSLKEHMLSVQSEMKSNYVGYASWAQELASRTK